MKEIKAKQGKIFKRINDDGEVLFATAIYGTPTDVDQERVRYEEVAMAEYDDYLLTQKS